MIRPLDDMLGVAYHYLEAVFIFQHRNVQDFFNSLISGFLSPGNLSNWENHRSDLLFSTLFYKT